MSEDVKGPPRSTGWPYGGARWWKFDFHAHTPASEDYGAGPNQESLAIIEPRDWLKGFMRAGVDCVAVTDHNSGAWIDKLKSALEELEQEACKEYRNLYLFPGVEITANGGTHVLAIMDPGRSSADVEALLGSVGFHGTRGASDVAADQSVIEVVEAIDKAGAIAIPAHADMERGIWGLSGNTLRRLLQSDKLFAVEVVDSSEEPAMYRQENVDWTEVLGSDCHRPYDASPADRIGQYFTWVKMEEPSLLGLRLALLDGEHYSIKRSLDSEHFCPSDLPKHHIQELRVVDARLMGRGEPSIVTFSPWLNSIVGGRGTGKSTLIHALRICSGRDRELERLSDWSSARRIFERFNRVPNNRYDDGGLQDNTEIRLTIMRDGVRHLVRWSRETHLAVVEEETPSGEWRKSDVQSVTPERFPLRIFSQGQMAELAGGDGMALLDIIDEAASTAKHVHRIDECSAAYSQTRARTRSLDQKLKRKADLDLRLQDTERKLRSFERSGHSEILKMYRLRSRQQIELERHLDVADGVAARIDSLAEDLQPEDLDQRAFEDGSDESQIAVSAVEAIQAAVRAATVELARTADSLRKRVELQRAALARSSWQECVDSAAAAYTELNKTLSAEGIDDPGEYGRLVQERSRLEAELEVHESQAQERTRLIERAEQELASVFKARCALSEARNAFIRETLEGNEFVRMELRAFGDSGSLRSVERSLRETIGDEGHFESDILVMGGDGGTGIVAELLEGLPDDLSERCHEFGRRISRLRKRFAKACAGNGNFGGHFNNFLERRFSNVSEFLDKLLTWFPEDALCVEYDRSGRGLEFVPIAQASAGQRAAAMLAFLLAYGDEPLVLDQPEDDLDNHLIYDLVVRQIRENKLKRQIITVTHNPNIVVNGDAEVVHALDFMNGQCRVVQSGSLQDIGIRSEVCRVMEGGREAFERRYRRIIPTLSDA